MLNRRTFLSLAAGSLAAPRMALAQPASNMVALYANVGVDLTHYDVDDGQLTFMRKYDIDVGDKTMFWMGMVLL